MIDLKWSHQQKLKICDRPARLLLCANLYSSSCINKGDRFKDTSILEVRTHYKPTETFCTRISLPATHQGSIKVSSKTKHLGCFELTPQKQLFKKILDNSNHVYMRELIQILWWINPSQKWNSKSGKSALQQKEKTNKKIISFVTQYHPEVPNLKNILMSK